jgi:hypothetical protein
MKIAGRKRCGKMQVGTTDKIVMMTLLGGAAFGMVGVVSAFLPGPLWAVCLIGMAACVLTMITTVAIYVLKS